MKSFQAGRPLVMPLNSAGRSVAMATAVAMLAQIRYAPEARTSFRAGAPRGIAGKGEDARGAAGTLMERRVADDVPGCVRRRWLAAAPDELHAAKRAGDSERDAAGLCTLEINRRAAGRGVNCRQREAER